MNYPVISVADEKLPLPLPVQVPCPQASEAEAVVAVFEVEAGSAEDAIEKIQNGDVENSIDLGDELIDRTEE